MTNNIEAAEMAEFEKWWNGEEPMDFAYPGETVKSHAYAAWRAALAHATRGEAKCYACGKPATCEGHEGASSPVVPSMPACDDCCGHGNEDGKCWPIAPTPPPATGMKCWRDVEGTLPVRRDGDKVARVDPETAIPATSEAGTRGEVERVRAAVIDAAKAFRAHDETYLIANYENVAEEGERQRLIVKMLVAVDALLAAERSENGGDRG